MYKSRCITDLCKLSHVFLEGTARKNPPQSFREFDKDQKKLEPEDQKKLNKDQKKALCYVCKDSRESGNS